MSRQHNIEEGRTEFWSLLDRAFSSLLDPTSNLAQKENIVCSIESVIVELKNFQFLTCSSCDQLYVWIVQHFSQLLLTSDLSTFHEKITSCFGKLLETLSLTNHVLFNNVIKTFSFILESILNEISQITVKVTYFIVVSQDIIPPSCIKNRFPAIPIGKLSSFTSIFHCFHEVCSKNLNAIVVNAKSHILQIINIFCKIIEFSNEKNGFKTLFYITSKSLPLLTIKEWQNICACFKSFEIDREIQDTVLNLLQLFSSGYNPSEIHFLLLKTIVDVISCHTPHQTLDVNRWVKCAISSIENLPNHYVKHLDMNEILVLASSNQVMYDFLLAYLSKSVDYSVSTLEERMGVDNNISIPLSEIDDIWKHLLYNLNKSVENALSDIENRLQHLEHVVSILKVANKLSSTIKCQQKLLFFDLVSDRIFNLFLLVDPKISSSDIQMVSNLVILCKFCAIIMKEREIDDSGCLRSLFEFLIIPWNAGISPIWGQFKTLCYESLLSLFYVVLSMDIEAFTHMYTDLIFKIADLDHCLIPLLVHSICAAISYSPIDIVHELLDNFLKKCINPNTTEILFRSDITRDILPCFFSNSCKSMSCENGLTLICVVCDLKETHQQRNINQEPANFYMDFIGYSYVNLLIKSDTTCDLKNMLLKSIDRYTLHIPVLRRDDMLNSLSEFMAEHLLKVDFDLTSALKCFILDSQNQLILDKTHCALKKLLHMISSKGAHTNYPWRFRVFEFLMFISRLSKDFLWTSLTFVLSLLFIDSISNIEINYMKQKLIGVANSCQVSLKQLLIKHEKELSKMIVDKIINNIKSQKCDVESTVYSIARIFDMSPRAFLEFRCAPYMISYILITCDLEQAKLLISSLSNIKKTRVKDIIMKGFHIIFSTVYFIDDERCTSKALEFIEDICESRIDTLVYFAYKNLICYVLMNSHKPLKVCRFFECYALDAKSSEKPDQLILKNAMGYLTFIDAKLSSKSSSAYIIRSCLRSIPNLIQILGSESVDSIHIKLLATLRTGLPLHYESYAKECLEAWMYFIYSVNLPFLGPYLTTIFTLLKPLFACYPNDISKIFHFLVVQNGQAYPDYLPELFFVEDYKFAGMAEVCTAINEASKKFSVVKALYKTLEHIKNGAVDSRIHSLEYLFHLLKIKRCEILRMIQRNDNLPPVLKEMIGCLIMNIHYGNMDVKLLCAYCIGEIGAINPARYGSSLIDDSLVEFFDVTRNDFAKKIILKLTRALQRSEDSLSYNTIASTIQELLKLYFPSDLKVEIHTFLETLPRNDSAIVITMLESRYIFTESILMKRKHEKVGSNVGKNPFEWASSWASELIALIPPDLFESKVFKTCLPAIQLDSEVLEAILPHILLQTILTCSEDDKYLVEMELKFVLKFQEQSLLLPPQDINLFKSYTKKAPKFLNTEITEDKCVAIIFDLIDFLYKYFSFLKVTKNNSSHLLILAEFLKRFPGNFISLKSYMLKDYCRSLFYLERRLSSAKDGLTITPLKNIYAKLNDADGLLGVIRTSNSIPTAEESMLNHIVCGNIQDALPAYELLANKNSYSSECNRALVQCYLNTNSSCVASKLAHSFFNTSGENVTPAFCSEIVEAAWKNLMFADLSDHLQSFGDKMKNNWSWSIDIGLAYLDFSLLEFDSMNKKINSIRGNIAERLAAISNTPIGTYRQGYSHIVNLQILNELEKYAEFMKFIYQPQPQPPDKISKFFEDLNMDSRLEVLPLNGYSIYNVLSSRILILSLMNEMDETFPKPVTQVISTELGNSYLKAARLARKSSNLQMAHSYLALAEKYQPHALFIEKAKFHKSKFETETAICILKQGIEENSKLSISDGNLTFHKLSAQAKLLIARYNEENMNVDYHEGTRSYIDAIQTFPTEKNYRYLAQYLYQIHTLDAAPDSTQDRCNIQIEALKNFSNSLHYGCKYIYQSMFCIISLWLDFGMRFKETLEATKDQTRIISKSHTEVMNKLNALMSHNVEVLPTYMFMAVFSQLLSRLNHPFKGCQNLLIHIVSKVAVAYRHQAIWMMALIWKTPDPSQNKVFKDILAEIKKIEAMDLHSSKCSILKFLSIFNELVGMLINVCIKQVPADKQVIPLKAIASKLKLMLNKSDEKIMIPAQKFRTLSLPNVKHFEHNSQMDHKPFPLNLVYFIDVDDNVEVLQSLQRPKKIVFTGSDGLKYPFMCKPLDDLRLDSRIMEFSSVINMYLQRDPASCDRNLHIRTYSVVPLNPQNGLIEWVPNLLSIRSVVIKMFKMKNVPMQNLVELKKKVDSITDHAEKLKSFEQLLAMNPPMLHKWFFHNFASPDSWYLARKSFVRTTAVMSIVGYVVGLGDRHNENILIDTKNGDIMHVDYNCLFGRGEHFKVPEVVPFRLTQNIVKAMGSTGIEGHFMKACEITNRVIRNHSDQLLYVLKPFLYDPKLQKCTKSQEKTKANISTIQKKMAGFVLTPKKKTQALSVEGQVRCLISEATNPENLSQMFFGWLPFM